MSPNCPTEDPPSSCPFIAEITRVGEQMKRVNERLDEGSENFEEIKKSLESLKSARLRTQGFLEGVKWIVGGLVTFFGILPPLAEWLKKIGH
ncbi:MAG: hypothetical protein HQM01_08200 [Magnetococcales bacterium]|nr:hypothetical protein [Magnetococcales bacterium]